MEDDGEMDGEIVGQRFNAGIGMGTEVPVELMLIGNKQNLKVKCKNKADRTRNLFSH